MSSSNMINIETTNLCSARCVTCPRESFQQKLGSMDMSLFEKIVDTCERLGITYFDLCGFGDPFTDSKFIKKLAYIKAKIPLSKTYISTTGYLLHPSLYEDISHLVHTLKLSIYSTKPYIYGQLHKLAFYRVMSNLEGFLEHIRASTTKPYTIGLMVLDKLNVDEMQDWIKYWEPKLDEVMVWKPHNWITHRDYRTIDKTNQRSCGRPSNGPLYVHVDGTVSACCWDINGSILLGNLNDQTIEEVLQSPVLAKLCQDHSDNNFKDWICKDCDQTNLNPDVLVYTNGQRKPGLLTPNLIKL